MNTKLTKGDLEVFSISEKEIKKEDYVMRCWKTVHNLKEFIRYVEEMEVDNRKRILFDYMESIDNQIADLKTLIKK
jgi:hypothetical protein